jgi:hypothetical protein
VRTETDAADKFFDALRGSLGAGSFVKLTLGKHRGGDSSLKNVYVKPVTIKDAPRLSVTYRHATKDVVKNLSFDDGMEALRALVGAEFLSGHLFTTGGDFRLDLNRRGAARLSEGPATFKDAATPAHDRRKRRLIETEGNVYLRALGVTDEQGRVRPAMGDKFRQINKFVETVAQLHSSSPAASGREPSVVDMGSGKGYLTFAVYDYLKNSLGLAPTVVGVEARADLVELCNRIAREAGFDGLSFRQGLIDDYDIGATDVLIALHACDTATDDAIHKGVRAGASVIITAPCCHKEVRPQIKAPAALAGVLRHGILLEREAESVTDSLRALLLEHAGYSVKVFEFISTEHTRKNTMIAAVRREGGAARSASALDEVRALKEFYRIGEQRLERLLCGVEP